MTHAFLSLFLGCLISSRCGVTAIGELHHFSLSQVCIFFSCCFSFPHFSPFSAFTRRLTVVIRRGKVWQKPGLLCVRSWSFQYGLKGGNEAKAGECIWRSGGQHNDCNTDGSLAGPNGGGLGPFLLLVPLATATLPVTLILRVFFFPLAVSLLLAGRVFLISFPVRVVLPDCSATVSLPRL